ncbi:uncharacterized protein FOMMEDRAFT_157523 [Fomitiporia mediterranea MF3/22]|uniref:uncharacterized protein n=1 Tax=Fomitiporia mediterranea (strain MF3/22) TaxID=694068 RepID=UPI000440737C|nr:uncharacterized protein FOMMEDRAFT_157523 [Fomitiporia mediterranea MF3/22]EJD02305.1 hypothetical protein FOMMEDRAFT_157523 [Fomitiporia mediterranea MF3/22]
MSTTRFSSARSLTLDFLLNDDYLEHGSKMPRRRRLHCVRCASVFFVLGALARSIRGKSLRFILDLVSLGVVSQSAATSRPCSIFTFYDKHLWSEIASVRQECKMNAFGTTLTIPAGSQASYPSPSNVRTVTQSRWERAFDQTQVISGFMACTNALLVLRASTSNSSPIVSIWRIGI